MKEIIKKIKIQIEGGKATSAPPIGPILSQNGVNPNSFIKLFNEKTKTNIGYLFSVKIIIFNDKSFDFSLLTMPISKLILNKLNLKKGSKSSNVIVSKIDNYTLNELIKLKEKDFPKISKTSLKKMILGTAKNMGILYVPDISSRT